jgi:hypothetical protein
MARCPIVRPETVRVTLKDGEWLDLAKELTAGEYRDMHVAQMKDTPAGSGFVLDYRHVGFSTILAYVKEWSFVDLDGKPLPVSEDWLRKFNTATFDEIREAAEAHHAASEKAVDEQKNELAGAAKS